MEINPKKTDFDSLISGMGADDLITEIDDRTLMLSETTDSDIQLELVDEIKAIHKKLNRLRARSNE